MAGDTDAFTTSICEKQGWQDEVQTQCKLKIDLQSYIPGESEVIEAALQKSAILIYEKGDGGSDSTD